MRLQIVTCALAALLLSTRADNEEIIQVDTMQVNNLQNRSFEGVFYIPLNETILGWKATITFNIPISMIYDGDWISHSQDEKTWEFVSKYYNVAVYENGSTFQLMFNGGYSGSVIPSSKLTLQNMVYGTLSSVPEIKGTILQVNTMHVRNLPSKSFEGVFDIPLNENFVGWKATINFTAPVSNIMMYDGDWMSHTKDMEIWEFVNKNYKAIFKNGTTLQLKFTGMYLGSVEPSAELKLQNLGHDTWSVPEATDTDGSKYNYNDVLFKSLLFYEAQRSGTLPRKNRIPWRGDSAVFDGLLENGMDLQGGWYDADDHVKFNFPMAYSVTILAWGYLEYKYAYKSAGQEEYLLDGIKWVLDYLLKCHTGPEELYVQVGDAGADHAFWGIAEQMSMLRPAFKITAAKPGSDIAMETAAAMAAGYLVFETNNPTYADTLLTHAKQLWKFGNNHHGIYSESVPQAAGFYTSSNYTDELGWGSLWLYKATNDSKYLAEAEKQFDPEPAWGQSWDEKTVGNQILMYKATHNDRYKTAVINSFLGWLPGGKVPYTPKGLAFRQQKGSLRYASNMAMAALIAADAGIMTTDLRHWAMCQIHYVLGDTGFSYVVGFGTSYPHNPHHRSSSCPRAPAPCGSDIFNSDIPNVHTLYGAMVGGPGQNDDYKDNRTNSINNEVACDYNAGFQGAVAGLKHLMLTGEHPEKTGNAVCPFHSGTVIGR